MLNVEEEGTLSNLLKSCLLWENNLILCTWLRITGRSKSGKESEIQPRLQPSAATSHIKLHVFSPPEVVQNKKIRIQGPSIYKYHKYKDTSSTSNVVRSHHWKCSRVSSACSYERMHQTLNKINSPPSGANSSTAWEQLSRPTVLMVESTMDLLEYN